MSFSSLFSIDSVIGLCVLFTAFLVLSLVSTHWLIRSPTESAADSPTASSCRAGLLGAQWRSGGKWAACAPSSSRGPAAVVWWGRAFCSPGSGLPPAWLHGRGGPCPPTPKPRAWSGCQQKRKAGTPHCTTTHGHPLILEKALRVLKGSSFIKTCN